jgi:glucokinase
MSRQTTIAIDIGGTKTAIAAISFPDARIERRSESPTPRGAESGQRFLTEISNTAREWARAEKADAVGVAICELVGRDGAVKSTHRVQLSELPVREAFGDIPTVIESDVRAGALAEARFGAGRAFEDMLYVNIGTGVSSSWVQRGAVHQGARGNALVLASSPIDFKCPSCGREVSYVPEDVAGGEGLAIRYRDAGGSARTGREVLEAAEAGDASASEIVKDAIRALGVNIGIAVNILDPSALVIGGGLAHGFFARGLDHAIRDHIWSEDTRLLPILAAELGQDSGLVGAAVVAAELVQGMSSPKLR